MTYRHPLAVSTLTEAESGAVAEVMASGRVTMGEQTARFERIVADEYGVADAVMVNSGSSANLLALAAAMQRFGNRTLAPGDEVIVPAVTWPTQIWPVAQLGMVPVFVDVDEHTFGIDPERLQEVVSKRTKAVSVAHLLGNPADIKAIGRFCLDWGLELFEDCCEAMDATVDDDPVGTFGRFGTLSFYFSHHLTTIEGGMILCRDWQDGSVLRSLRSHGMSRQMHPRHRGAVEGLHPDIDPRFLFAMPGYNMRPMELQAAMGIVQWEKRLAWRERRRAIARAWSEALPRGGHLSTLPFADGANPFAFPLIVRTSAPLRRRDLVAHLEACGIETRPIVAGAVSLQPASHEIPRREGRDMRGTMLLHERGCYIGINPLTRDEDVAFVAGVLSEAAVMESAA